MKPVGIFHAKTHLSALVAEVEKGREIVITRSGRPVARLVPATAGSGREEIARRRKAVADFVAAAGAVRSRVRPKATRAEIAEWIAAGRR